MLVVFNGCDEWEVVFFTRAERITFGQSSFIGLVTDAGAERECFGVGVEILRFREFERIVRSEIFCEAVDVIVHKIVDGFGVGDYIDFD